MWNEHCFDGQSRAIEVLREDHVARTVLVMHASVARFTRDEDNFGFLVGVN